MSFPDETLDVRVEAAMGADLTADPGTWTWTDIGALGEGVYDDGDLVLDDGDPVTEGGWGRLLDQSLQIRRGRADESSRTQPASVSFTLDNPDGWLTPKNPASPFFGKWGRGTPIRVRVPAPAVTETALQGTATTPDDPQLDVVGGIDIRIDADMDWHRDAALLTRTAGLTTRYELRVTSGLIRGSNPDRGTRLLFRWVPFIGAPLVSPVIPSGRGRRSYRVRFEYDAANDLARAFWYQAEQFGDWQLWDVTPWTLGNGGIVAGDMGATLAAGDGVSLYRLEVMDDSDNLVIGADLTSVPAGSPSFVDDAGLTWTVTSGGIVEVPQPDPSARMIGQVAECATAWPHGDLETDTTPGESRVQVQVAGTLRRLGQATKPLQSALRRFLLDAAANPWGDGIPAGYWPMEEGKDASGASSALPGGAAMLTRGAQFGADTGLASSAALPVFPDGGSWQAPISTAPAGTTEWYAVMVMRFKDPSASGRFLTYTTADTIFTVTLGGGSLTLTATDLNGTTVDSMTVSSSGIDDSWMMVALNGSNIDVVPLDTTDWSLSGAVHANVSVFGSPILTSLRGTPRAGDAVGHVAVGMRTMINLRPDSVLWAARGYAGETAVARFTRLCVEQGIPVEAFQPQLHSERMGVQEIASLLDLLQECADADLAMIGEQHNRLGLTWRPAPFSRPVGTVLDAGQSEIANPFEPVEDDQRIRNDVTATRVDGASTRAVDEASMHLEGRYDTDVRLRLYSDAQTAGQAGWRLHLGTWPGMRYPSVTVDLAVAPHLIPDVTQVREGDRIQVVNLPAQHPAGTVDLLVEGITETLSPSGWTVEFTCSPAGPWTVGVVEDDVLGRADTAGSVLVGTISAGATGFGVTTLAGPRWVNLTLPDTPFDIEVGGEVMRVNRILGTDPANQTFDVTRAVNGVVKSHPAGTPVSLAHPAVAAL